MSAGEGGVASEDAPVARARLRAPVQVWLPTAFVWTLFAVFVIALATAPLGGSTGTAVAVPLALLVTAVAVTRARSMAVEVDAEGARMRNLWSTESVRWGDVEEVLGVRGLMPFSSMVGFRVRGQSGFMSKLPAAQATTFGGQTEERRRLLAALRHHCDRHGIRCRLILESHGTWNTTA